MAVGLHPRYPSFYLRVTPSNPLARKSRDVPKTRLAFTDFQTRHVLYKSSRRGHNPLSRKSAIVTCRSTAPVVVKHAPNLLSTRGECEREYIKFVLTQIISRENALRDLVENSPLFSISPSLSLSLARFIEKVRGPLCFHRKLRSRLNVTSKGCVVRLFAS